MAPPFGFSQESDNNPHFFKVVLDHALQEQKLEIPTKFVRKHGQTAFLNNQTICLKVADGRGWNVGVTKTDGRVWLFHHGWQKFVEFYSVGLNYFLVFRYEKRSSSFHVVIFDHTGIEIKYPTKQNCVNKVVENIKVETSLDDQDLGFYSQGCKIISGDMPCDINRGKRGGASTTSRETTAMSKAITFQSMTLNPSFISKISPSHCEPAKCLGVPKRFVEMHLKLETIETVLQVSDGRTWSLYCSAYRCRNKKIRAELRNGWKKFAGDNKLGVGDVCVFEIIRKNPKRILFKVQIFSAS